MSGKHNNGRKHKAKGLGPTLSRRERVDLLQLFAPEGTVAVNSHGEATLVTARQNGEAILPGTGGLTELQLNESSQHGTEVMRRREAEESIRRQMTMGEFLRGGRK